MKGEKEWGSNDMKRGKWKREKKGRREWEMEYEGKRKGKRKRGGGIAEIQTVLRLEMEKNLWEGKRRYKKRIEKEGRKMGSEKIRGEEMARGDILIRKER